jgi:hypothetical protein
MGTQLEHCVWSQHEGEHGDFFRNTFEAPCGIATQHAISYEAFIHCPTQRSREAIPSSGEGVPSDVATHNSREGVRSGKKRHKQHLQPAMMMATMGTQVAPRMRHNSVTAQSDKHRTRPPTVHIKRLMEEACPNHTYPIRTAA